MTKNPFLNAALASAYIIAIVNLISFFGNIGEDKPDTVFIPMAMLSLLVLSVATMGLLFFVEPLRMFLDGKRTEAVSFFLKTLGTFAAITLVLVITMLSVTVS